MGPRAILTLAERVAVTQSTLDKFRGKAFEWGTGDCLKMLRSHCVAMGYKGLPKLPRYSTPVQAIRRLKEQGHDSIDGLCRAHFEECAPAAMLVGDIGIVEGDGALDAIVISAGVWCIGYPFEDAGCQAVRLQGFKTAFHV